MRRRRNMGATGDANDPYAGSAYYGAPDTFYQDNPEYAYVPDPNDQGMLQNFINDFHEKLAELDAQIVALGNAENQLLAVQDIAAQNPADMAEWQAEYDKIHAVNATINAAKSAAAQVDDWWQSAKSYVGLSGARHGARSLLNGALGVLPFAIPWGIVATIAGATAAIAAVIYSVSALVDRLNLKAWNDENIRRSQQGLPPLPKPDTTQQSIFGDVSDLGRTMLMIGLAYFLLPPLLKRLEHHG